MNNCCFGLKIPITFVGRYLKWSGCVWPPDMTSFFSLRYMYIRKRGTIICNSDGPIAGNFVYQFKNLAYLRGALSVILWCREEFFVHEGIASLGHCSSDFTVASTPSTSNFFASQSISNRILNTMVLIQLFCLVQLVSQPIPFQSFQMIL